MSSQRALATIDSGFEDSENRQVIAELLERLPSREREIVRLRVYGPGNPAVRSHRQPFGAIQTDLLEAKARCARSRPGRHEEAIGVDVRAGVEHSSDPATTLLHPDGRDPAPHTDSVGGECVVEDVADLRREVREFVWRRVEEVHLGTEPGEDRCQFTTDHPATDDRESNRLLLGGQASALVQHRSPSVSRPVISGIATSEPVAIMVGTIQQMSNPLVITELGSNSVALRGEVDAHTAPTLAQRFRTLPAGDIVIDMADVTFMDSNGLRVLIDLQQRAVEASHRLILDAPSPSVIRLLEVSGLTDHFSIGREPNTDSN